MIKVISVSLMVLFCSALCGAAAEDSAHFIEQLRLSGGHIVVVAEGEAEPRSIGSYSVRIYSGVNPLFPLDNFLMGIILPREGSVEKVLIEDINGDNNDEIVVVQRSAGSGSYLAVDAIQYRDKNLSLMISLGGMGPTADVLAALRKKIAESVNN